MIDPQTDEIYGCVYHHFSGVELKFPNNFHDDFFLQMINARLFSLGG